MSQRDGESSTGIFSTVLGYVSRELDGFVTNATGGAITLGTQRQRRVKTIRKSSSMPRIHRGLQRQSKAGHPTKRHVEQEDDSSEESDAPKSQSPPPPSTDALRRRRASINMPGSFLPRSPTPEEPRVRFSSPASTASLEEASPPLRIASTSKATFPPRGVTSVKTAVEKFRPDADASLLLPHSSPPKASDRSSYQKASENGHSSLKGKERATQPDIDFDTSGEVRIRGKERELIAAREDYRLNQKRRENDREDQDASRERLKDKEKIRQLEEEVRRLRNELSRRTSHSFPVTAPPPPPPAPPPPPPPPPGYVSRVSTTAPDTLFASARASLKHAPPPQEAPINPPFKAKGLGVVPPDKMAAFLTEMKTVRLRKISGELPGLRDRLGIPDRTGDLSASSSSSSLTRSTNQAADRLNPRIGEKRKRFDSGVAGTSLAVNRRHTITDGIPSKRRSFGSIDSDLTVSAQTSAHPLPSETTGFSSRPSSALFPTQSRPANDTPSLTSDNDRENEPSLDDLPPSTPLSTPVFAEPPVRVQHSREPDIIDVEMGDEPARSRQRFSSSTMFDKRPPVSPMPNPSPRKPPPPARTSSRSVPRLQYRQSEQDDDRDPLSISPSQTQPAIPSSSRQKTTRPKTSQKKRQGRKTLDEELKSAIDDRSSRLAETSLTLDQDLEIESGTLTGVGKRSKRRGFLAHGGAGGEPVFMGVGYIEGVEESDSLGEDYEDDDSEYRPNKRSLKSRKSSKR